MNDAVSMAFGTALLAYLGSYLFLPDDPSRGEAFAKCLIPAFVINLIAWLILT